MHEHDSNFTICSLVPGATEILCSLGLEGNIIGISDLCYYPESIQDKPIVSNSRVITEGFTSAQVELEMKRILESGQVPYDVDVEWFKSQRPDLIITQDNCNICEIDIDFIQSRLNQFGYKPEVLVIDPKSISQIYTSIREIAFSTNKVIAGEALICGLRLRIKELLDVFHDYPPTRVISIEGVDPLVLGGNWIPEMYRLLGCDYGIMKKGSSAMRIKIEEIVNFDPEYIFVDLCSSSLERQVKEVKWLFELPDFLDITAIKMNNFYILEHEYYSNPGPRIIDGIELVANILKPGSCETPGLKGLKLVNNPPKENGMRDYAGLV